MSTPPTGSGTATSPTSYVKAHFAWLAGLLGFIVGALVGHFLHR